MEQIFSFFAERFDLPILDWIAANLHFPLLDTLMSGVTMLGEAGIFWIVLAVLCLCFPKYRKAGISMGLAMVMGLLLCNVIMKPLFARIRPYNYQLLYHGRVIPLLVERLHDYSFPSGHTISSFEAAMALTLNHKKPGIAALVLASMIAFSRLYLYVHYPTDVLVSVVLGIGLAFLAQFLVNKACHYYETRRSV